MFKADFKCSVCRVLKILPSHLGLAKTIAWSDVLSYGSCIPSVPEPGIKESFDKSFGNVFYSKKKFVTIAAIHSL